MSNHLNPDVSVIVPCYNGEDYISETIQSVLDQSYESLELIIVDDGSLDRTGDVIAQCSDARLRYFRTKNCGVSHARNFGIGMARGEFIAFLDADDLFMPENLSVKIGFLREHLDMDLVHAPEIIFDGNTGAHQRVSSGLGGTVLSELLVLEKTVIHSPSSVLVRRKLLAATGLFDERLSVSADWDMWVRMALVTPFGFLGSPYTKYRLHQNQMHSNIGQMEKDMSTSFDKLQTLGVWRNKKALRRSKAKLFLTLCLCYIKDEPRFLRSLHFLLRSLINTPSVLFVYLRKRF
jgi:glycosyltransferase involved in cell wall biosynthesis